MVKPPTTYQYVTPHQTYTVWLDYYIYANGRMAITLADEEGPVATATVNLPQYPLADGHVFIKTWSENKPMLDFLVKNGIVADTGVRVPTGYCEAAVVRLLKR